MGAGAVVRWRRLFQRGPSAAEQVLMADRDRLEIRLSKMQRDYEALAEAHKSLVTSLNLKTQMDAFSTLLNEMFTEEELAEDKRTYLTPTLEEREGIPASE